VKRLSIAAAERGAICLVLAAALVVALLASFQSTHTYGTMKYPSMDLEFWGKMDSGKLVKFESYEELKEFLGTNIDLPAWPTASGQRGFVLFSNNTDMAGDFSNWEVAPDYSPTNIQVEGVYEADIVKTDGKYIYFILASKIVIVEAYPAENAEVLCEIELNGNLEGMYIMEDILVIIETVYGYSESEEQYIYETRTHVKVYDVEDRETPVLTQDVSVDGNYINSRMIGDHVYVITNKTTYGTDDETDLPNVYLGENTMEIPAEEILHSPEEPGGRQFTTVLSFNVRDLEEDVEHLSCATILTSWMSNIYVSQDNIYITGTKWYSEEDCQETTSIHKIHLDAGELDYVASGRVPGRLLNQFSMDEHDGYFRVATTIGQVWQSGEDTSFNHLYVLDEKLNIVGKLENLAPGESIYSARFMDGRCYLVTFRKVDPFFVIDLSKPHAPKVLGELKITGYSDYLHPYDENHIIGIGKETEDGLNQGVKISLFDVSNVSNPREIAKFEIGDRGTHSPVLNDHKALLFDKARNLLVIPVSVAEKVTTGRSPAGESGYPTWQGAYVFHISVENGLELRERITHHDDDAEVNHERWYGYYSREDIKRSLYIGDVLYTLSDAKIQMHDLESLDFKNEVELTIGPNDSVRNVWF